MDFRFSDEQKITAETVRNLLADRCAPADLRRLLQSGEARDPARWDALVGLGLQGTLVPESKGGLGLSCTDFVLVAEACGYAGLPEPLVENTGVTLPLLATLADDPHSRVVLDRALAGEITVALAHPANPFVADADTAGAILVVRDGACFVHDAATVPLLRQPSIDPFRRLFSLTGRSNESAGIGDTPILREALDAALDRGALFAAAQLVGIAQRAVDLAVGYARDRNQFGKPIGSYQAVKHSLASAQVRIEFAKPVVYAAAAQLANGDVFSRARISHAKLAAAEAADIACRSAIQVHGAMGYSWEVDVHFFLKRMLALSGWWGDLHFHRNRVAACAFSHPPGPEQTFASEAELP